MILLNYMKSIECQHLNIFQYSTFDFLARVRPFYRLSSFVFRFHILNNHLHACVYSVRCLRRRSLPISLFVRNHTLMSIINTIDQNYVAVYLLIFPIIYYFCDYQVDPFYTLNIHFSVLYFRYDFSMNERVDVLDRERGIYMNVGVGCWKPKQTKKNLKWCQDYKSNFEVGIDHASKQVTRQENSGKGQKEWQWLNN